MAIKQVVTISLWLASCACAYAQPADEVSRAPSPSRPGPTINGASSVDPSENVKALSEAANKRQDDLRLAAKELLDMKLTYIEKLNELSDKMNRDLREAAIQRLDAENKIRTEFTERLLIAEAKRIDAIRAVDVNAVAVANQRTSEQATALQTQTTQSAEVLRNQVTRSAEDLRALVATTAATQLQNQQQQFNAILGQIAALSTRITTLEQSGAETKGGRAPADPVITTLLSEVRALQSARSQMTGVDSGRSDVIGFIVGGFGLLLALGGFVIALLNRKASPVMAAPVVAVAGPPEKAK